MGFRCYMLLPENATHRKVKPGSPRGKGRPWERGGLQGLGLVWESVTGVNTHLNSPEKQTARPRRVFSGRGWKAERAEGNVDAAQSPAVGIGWGR